MFIIKNPENETEKFERVLGMSVQALKSVTGKEVILQGCEFNTEEVIKLIKKGGCILCYGYITYSHSEWESLYKTIESTRKEERVFFPTPLERNDFLKCLCVDDMFPPHTYIRTKFIIQFPNQDELVFAVQDLLGNLHTIDFYHNSKSLESHVKDEIRRIFNLILLQINFIDTGLNDLMILATKYSDKLDDTLKTMKENLPSFLKTEVTFNKNAYREYISLELLKAKEDLKNSWEAHYLQKELKLEAEREKLHSEIESAREEGFGIALKLLDTPGWTLSDSKDYLIYEKPIYVSKIKKGNKIVTLREGDCKMYIDGLQVSLPSTLKQFWRGGNYLADKTSCKSAFHLHVSNLNSVCIGTLESEPSFTEVLRKLPETLATINLDSPNVNVDASKAIELFEKYSQEQKDETSIFTTE
jgi:hypothetical protein